MNIAVIGSGYVGLVAAACFADTGNNVICVDHNPDKIKALKDANIPIYEPGLEDLVKRCASLERLSFTTSTAEAVAKSEIIFIAVNTPTLASGEADLSFLKKAAEDIGHAMQGYKLVVNKSTVPIGSHRLVADWISVRTRHPVDVVSNPEFLKEGTALDDFLRPDRIVIGTEKEEVYRKLADLYSPFVRQGNPILWMDPLSAEITKYACNSFLATRISFMNELAQLCEKVGGDVEEVRKGMTTDARIGKHFLYPGVGYGGSCFPKDVQALIGTAKKSGVKMGVVEAVEDANQRQKLVLANKIKNHFKNLNGKTIAVWGLAFKPNTDDMREAPSITIIQNLLSEGAKIRAYDPEAETTARKVFSDSIDYCSSAFDALKTADALVVVTEWNEFRHPDFEKIKTTLKHPVIFDGRNIYNPKQMKALGFTYYAIGRS